MLARVIGLSLPWWTVLPFVALLAAIALGPLAAPGWWRRRHGWVSLGFGAPVCLYLLSRDAASWGPAYLQTARDYLSFLALLFALFVISGGVLLRGHLAGTPAVNAALLGTGALLASLVGTTGASMLLLRPLLQANRRRIHRAHTVVFFIFLVSNAGGCLTPLGDPPLFLGYLRGVPFEWTFLLLKPWAFTCGTLLGIYLVLEALMFRREAPVSEASGLHDPLGLDGGINLLLLGGVVGASVLAGRLRWPFGVQEALLLALAGLSWKLTPKRLREANAFRFHPIVEVGVLFAGIFAAMVPALALLEAAPQRWPELQPTQPWQYFWATGLLSSILDNAPTYLSFTALASGSLGVNPGHLGSLLALPAGPALLEAISLGAVFFGAMTYLGNGPNLLVKAVAEEAGVPMPSFLGYLAWSVTILVPVFLAVTWIFL